MDSASTSNIKALAKRKIRSIPVLHAATWKARQFIATSLLNIPETLSYEGHRRQFKLDAQSQNALNHIRKFGYATLSNPFSENALNQLHASFQSALKNPSSLDETAMNKYNRDRLRIKDPLLTLPEVARFVFFPELLKIVANYKGYIPQFSFQVYRHLPTEHLIASRNFHRDEEGMFSAFIYMSDITPEKGPLVVVPKSHKYTIRSCRPIMNYDKGVYEGNTEYSDDEIDQHYPSSTWQSLEVKRGTLLFLDASAFHKGPHWNLANSGNLPRDCIHLNFSCRRLDQLKYPHIMKIPQQLKQSSDCISRLFAQNMIPV